VREGAASSSAEPPDPDQVVRGSGPRVSTGSGWMAQWLPLLLGILLVAAYFLLHKR
jgi:hypothetical protein